MGPLQDLYQWYFLFLYRFLLNTSRLVHLYDWKIQNIICLQNICFRFKKSKLIFLVKNLLLVFGQKIALEICFRDFSQPVSPKYLSFDILFCDKTSVSDHLTFIYPFSLFHPYLFMKKMAIMSDLSNMKPEHTFGVEIYMYVCVCVCVYIYINIHKKIDCFWIQRAAWCCLKSVSVIFSCFCFIRLPQV